MSDSVIAYALATYMQVTSRGSGGGGAVVEEAGVAEAPPTSCGQASPFIPATAGPPATGSTHCTTRATATSCCIATATARRCGARLLSARPAKPPCKATATSSSTTRPGRPQWWSGTAGYSGAWLAVQSDGNLVVYDAYGYPDLVAAVNETLRAGSRGHSWSSPAWASARPAGRRPSPVQQAVPRRLWHLPDLGRGGAAADETSAYFLSKSHEVLAVDIATGTVRWRRTTLEEGDAALGRRRPPRRRLGRRRRLQPAGLRSPHWRPAVAIRACGWLWTWRLSRSRCRRRRPGRLSERPSLRRRRRERRAPVVARVAADGKTTVFAPAVESGLVAAGYTEFTAPSGGGVACWPPAMGACSGSGDFPDLRMRSLSTNWAGGPVFRGDEVIAASGDGRVHAFDLASGDAALDHPEGHRTVPVSDGRRSRLPAARAGWRPAGQRLAHRRRSSRTISPPGPSAGASPPPALARRLSASPLWTMPSMCRSRMAGWWRSERRTGASAGESAIGRRASSGRLRREGTRCS